MEREPLEVQGGQQQAARPTVLYVIIAGLVMLIAVLASWIAVLLPYVGRGAPEPVASASLTPGWLVERLFHAEAIVCPWQTTDEWPGDEDCQARVARIGRLTEAIAVCEQPLRPTPRSVAHRGAPLIAPEHTEVSYRIGGELGAGYSECDASVTKDFEFICRHGLCELDFTTDLIANYPELNEKCTVPFVPGSGVNARCCTTDFTWEELKPLCAKMNLYRNPWAETFEGYLIGQPGFRTGAIANETCHKIMSFKESMALAKEYGWHVIPELKDTWFDVMYAFLDANGRDIYWLAEKLATELYEAGFRPWPESGAPIAKEGELLGILQTFDHRIAEHWKRTGGSAWTVLYLWKTIPPEGQDCVAPNDCGSEALIQRLQALGLDIFAPVLQLLITNGTGRQIVPAETADMLKANNVRSIGTWTLDRQGCSQNPNGPFAQPLSPQFGPQHMGPCWDPTAWYYSTIDGTAAWQYADTLVILDVLFKEVGIESVFSDWPLSVSAYVNCVFEPNGYGPTSYQPTLSAV